MSEQNKITEFWSDIQNVKNASPEDIQSDVLAYLRLIEKKNAEIERKDEALRFYADEDNYKVAVTETDWGPIVAIDKDGGQRAREAL